MEVIKEPVNIGEHPIVLFDGVCNLCSGWVQFVIRRDPDAVFLFASLQSEVGRSLSEKHGIDPDQLDSVVLIDGDQAYQRSDAALRVARYLDGPWRRAAVLLIVPRFIRNSVYRLIAWQRYRLFGRQESCWLPTEQLRKRFLTDEVFIEQPEPSGQPSDRAPDQANDQASDQKADACP